MTEFEKLCLCALREAGGEPDDGVAAVVQVILNRTRLGYNSDQTISGTIDRHAQFSWTEYDMVGGVYTRVAHSPDEQAAREERLLAAAQSSPNVWARIQHIVIAVQAGTYTGPDFAKITTDTVLYLNPRISRPQPWQVAANFVATVGHHDFYRDPPRSGPVTGVIDMTDFAQDATKTALG